MCVGVPLLTYRRPEGVQFPLLYFMLHMVIATVVMVCFMAVAQFAFQTLWVFISNNRGVLGEHELEIRDEGLVERTAYNESLHRWTGFQKIGMSRKYLFVFVTDNNVEYVPLRIFASDADAKKFREELQKRADVAKPGRRKD